MTSNCKNCGAALSGKYCQHCGQKTIHPEERRLHHIAHEFFHHLTHLDGKFFSALRNLLTRPGLMTRDAMAGITVRHFNPSSLFLVGTLLYFLFPNQYSIRSNMVTTYRQEVQGGGVSAFKRHMAEAKMQRRHLTPAQVAEGFDARKHAYGKLLAFLLIPLTVPVLGAINLVSRRLRGSIQLTTFDLGLASLEINSLIIIGFYVVASVLVSGVFALWPNAYVVTAVTGTCFLILLYLLYRFFRQVLHLSYRQGLLALVLFLIGYTGVLVVYGIVTFALLI